MISFYYFSNNDLEKALYYARKLVELIPKHTYLIPKMGEYLKILKNTLFVNTHPIEADVDEFIRWLIEKMDLKELYDDLENDNYEDFLEENPQEEDLSELLVTLEKQIKAKKK